MIAESESVGIPCEWVPIEKSSFIKDTEDLRSGRYSQCYFNVPGYGVSSWVVVGYLKVDYQKHLAEGKTLDEVAKDCADFLSQPPPRKKYQKKPSKPLYGALQPLPAPWLGRDKVAVKAKPGFDNRLIVEFITDKRKNKNFWDEGPSLLGNITTKKVKKKKEKNK